MDHVISQSQTVFAPGVGSSYRNAWGKLWKYFLELFLIGIIAFLIGLPGNIGTFIDASATGSFFTPSDKFTFWDFFGLLYGLFIGIPVGYGVSYAYLRAARGDKLEINNMFEGFKNYWNAILANLLVAAIVMVGLVLLIIPGFIFAIKLSFTPYLVVDRKMPVLDAVREIWRMTGGHSWQILFIGLLAIPIFIAGLIVLIIGVIPAVMLVTLAAASLYHAVSMTAKAQVQTAV